jgi:hypothetical protein
MCSLIHHSILQISPEDASLSKPHLHFAHRLWSQFLQPEDWVIDATCGAGKDSFYLATRVSGLICMDIQEAAMEKTKKALSALSPEIFKKIYYILGCHSTFPEIAYSHPIRLIVYNLGYLPGGDKKITTLESSTLQSIEKAMQLISPGGMISITCYPGHPQGVEEKKALLKRLARLDAIRWTVAHYGQPARPTAPSLFVLKNIYK